MKVKNNFASTLVLSMLLVGKLQAGAVNLNKGAFYLWDNEEGLISAANQSCELIQGKDSNLYLSYYFSKANDGALVENLRDEKQEIKYILLNGSLVKTTGNTLKTSYQEVKFLGNNQNELNQEYVEKNNLQEKVAARFDQGYIYNQSLRSLKLFSFKISSEKESALNGKFLRAEYYQEEDSEKIAYLRCKSSAGQRDYQVFSLFDTDDIQDASAYVGIYDEETDILKNYVVSEEGIEDVESSYKNLTHSFVDFMQKNKNEISSDGSQNVAVSATQASKVDTVQGSFQNIICSKGQISIRDEEATKVLFKVNPGELVKIFQGFEATKKARKIDGKMQNIIKIELPDREAKDQKSGWVVEQYVKLEGECEQVKKSKVDDEQIGANITGLKDSGCCNFPTSVRPTEAYTSGMRQFGYSRGGGRLHAACDLYRYKNEPAYSVAPGKVINGLYEFYQGTFALEIKHSGGFVVRYGELTGKKADGMGNGKIVKAGQRVGYIGKVNSGCCEPMLHFELYSGSKSGTLSGSDKYRRRTDLINPTKYLQSWENKKFGKNY